MSRLSYQNLFVTEEIPITVSRQAADKEARPSYQNLSCVILIIMSFEYTMGT